MAADYFLFIEAVDILLARIVILDITEISRIAEEMRPAAEGLSEENRDVMLSHIDNIKGQL